MEEAIRVIIESVPNNFHSVLVTISGFLTPLIAITTVYIAWKQHSIEKIRLKNELYDRRSIVFAALDRLIMDFRHDCCITFERSHQFHNEIALSIFLFDEKVREYLTDMYEKSLKWYELQLKMYPQSGEPGLPVGDERQQVAKEQQEIASWILSQKKDSIKIFEKYFDFK